MSFVKWKFNRMLLVATAVMTVNYAVMLSSSVIVGNLVGTEGLAGVNACTPVFGVASFLASLLSVGTGLVFARAMGAFDERRAAGVFSQSMMAAIGLGAAIFAAMQLGETTFLDMTGVTGAIRLQAAHYWRWQALAMGMLPAVLTLEALVYADGDGPVAVAASATHVMGAIGLSAFYTWRSGDAGGASLGTAITMVAVLMVCSAHFWRANSHLKFRFCFSARDLRETIVASLADSTIYLCWGALIFVVNRFTVAEYGQYLLPVVALAASIVELSIIFDGVGEAIIPLGGMYAGEGNHPALRTLANHSALMATAEGVVCGALLFGFAPTIAAFYGFEPQNLKIFQAATDAVRILALAMPFMGLLMMMNTHYLVVGHVPFAVSVTVMKDFVCPCAGVLLLGGAGSHWGQRIWEGFLVGYVTAAAYPFLFVLIRHGRGLFPWLIARDDGRSTNFSVRLTERTLSEVKSRISKFLNGLGELNETEAIAAVAAEGAATLAANARPVLAEYYLTETDDGGVRLILRDNGKSRESSGGKYLNTLGCNRTEYLLARRAKRPQIPEARLNYLQNYVLSRMGKETSSQMFNLAKFFRLRQGIDLERLSAALTAAGESHAAMHTVLRRNAQGEFIQRQELPAGSVSCPIVRTNEAELLANRSGLIKTFNLDGGILFDAKIFDCGGGRAYLLSNFHHLICDGYSFPLILADAHRAWRGETLESDSYYEVLARREEKAARPIAVAGRNFMREMLKDCNFATLPDADFHGESGYGSVEVTISLPPTFDDILTAHKATRHHFFLAAAAMALKEITGKADVLLDWVFHGRISKEELKTVGAFMVDLPLVFDGTDDMTASDVIALVKRATFNGIKSVNNITNVTESNPTGQDRLTFIYQDEWGELMSPGPVREDGPYAWMIEETIPLLAPQAATENPFNVEIMEHRDATRLFVEYDTGLYSEATARRYAELFKKSLAWFIGEINENRKGTT